MAAKAPAIRRDWLSKSIAGVVLGFALGIAASALYVRFGPAVPLGANAQLAMWMVPPVWFTVLGFVFLFGSGRRAWLWLGGANLLLFGVLAAARHV